MSAIVDYEYYSTVYMGTEADEASFPALCARAEDVVGAMTRWHVDDEAFAGLSPKLQGMYRKAICAQVDYFAVNGLDSVAGGDSVGFSVGKVRVDGSAQRSTTAGAMSAHISPMTIAYLEQTGLMNPAVGVVPDMPVIGAWW